MTQPRLNINMSYQQQLVAYLKHKVHLATTTYKTACANDGDRYSRDYGSPERQKLANARAYRKRAAAERLAVMQVRLDKAECTMAQLEQQAGRNFLSHLATRATTGG